MKLFDAIQVTPQRLSDGIAEQISDLLAPLAQERLFEVVTTIPERLAQRTGELIVDVPCPQHQVEHAEVVQPIQHARNPARISEQMVDAPVPQVWEQSDEGEAAFPAPSAPQRSADVAGALAWQASQPVPAPGDQLAPAPAPLVLSLPSSRR